MDIDRDIANWVLEFLLMQPLEDRSVDSVIRVLPVPDDKPRLKKLLLLKKLESEASRQSVSESVLNLLEQLEEIEFQQGNESVSDSMKRAYCAVAVECTMSFLENDGGDCSMFEFFNRLQRVWRVRIAAMASGTKNRGLCSEELEIWREDMELAVLNDDALEIVKKKREGINAVEAVKNFVMNEREKLSPSFLELLADRLMTDETLWGSEIQMEQHHPRKKVVGGQCHKLPAKTLKVAKIVDSDEMEAEPSCTNRNLQFDKTISNGTRVSECEDPMEENHAEVIRESEVLDPVEEKCNVPKLFIVDAAGVIQATDSRNKPQKLQQNTSAHTYERDDSIDGSQDGLGISKNGHRSRRPSVINVSPLGKHRKRRKWTNLEEDTLRTAVQKYGRGNWKHILCIHPEIFQYRTEVDLKDKWRNMARY